MFTVLMSVYFKETPVNFSASMRSIWDFQTVKPSQIVLVEDGPLTSELYAVINEWKEKLGNVLECISLPTNLGLGDALNIGLSYCVYDLVARMDTDDIALPDRFEKQLEAFESLNCDVCGSWISEFDQDESLVSGRRIVPENHLDIIQYAKYRCPLNHPAVMYKKSAVIKAGGYQKMMWFEDYYLWVRMILSGAQFYNIQEPLVHMRAGIGQLERRSGKNYAKSELKFLARLRDIGFYTRIEFLKMIFLRVPVRLLPKSLIRIIYRIIRKA